MALILAWGSTFAAIKVGLESAPPILFSGVRSVIGGLAVAALATLSDRSLDLRGHLGGYALITLFNVIAFFGLQTLAIQHLPSGLAAVLIYVQPVLTGVLAAPLLGESLTAVKLTGLLLGFAGIVVVSVGAVRGHVSALGVGLAVSAALIWSIGTIVFKRESERIDAWWAVAVSFVVGGLVLTVAGGVTEGLAIDWSPSFGWALAYSSVIGTALAWALWFGLVGAGEASRAAAYIFFVPLVSLLVGAVLLGETLDLSLLLGAALVVVGVFLVNRRAREV
ncbi:MAG: DMT family transporter [Actinomycetota bacterium]|nr:DMT family transporter [Actinomycetota bacterium]